MAEQYKIVLTDESIYQEICLNKQEEIHIGNIDTSDYTMFHKRVKKPYSVMVSRNEDGSWQLDCETDVYISAEGILKQFTRKLTHGDDFCIKSVSDGSEVLRFRFVIDFDEVHQDYYRSIPIHVSSRPEENVIHIGGEPDCEIQISDDLMSDSRFELQVSPEGIYIDHIRCRYGLYLNGNIIRSRTKLQDWDFIRVLGYNFYYSEGILRTTEGKQIIIHNRDSYIQNLSEQMKQYPMFYRNTRVLPQKSDEAVSILNPPEEVKRPEGNILKSLLPMLAMLVLTVVLRGVLGGGGTFILFSACTMGIGIVTTIISFVSNHKEYKVNYKKREETYKNYIEKKKQEIQEARIEEKQYLEKLYPTVQQEYQMVQEFSADLFRCQLGDPDYLNLYLGRGTLPSCRQIEFRQQEQMEIRDGLAIIPEQIAKTYEVLEDVPITLDLKQIHAAGIVLEAEQVGELVRNWVTDLCTRHYHTEIKIILIAGEQQKKQVLWARYLPHVNDGDLRLIVIDEESRKNILEYMYKIFSMREDLGNKGGYLPEYVVFVLNDIGIRTHPVSRYLKHAGQYGFTFLFFEEQESRLPLGCDRVLRINAQKREGTLLWAKDENRIQTFRYTPLGSGQAEEIALRLAPVYTEEVSLENTLVKSITLYELLKITNVKKLDLDKRWGESDVAKTLAAPLGVNAKDEIVYLDLHEKAHGPHGLVAGTTGSGKSEILQSYILSMAILYHPHEVSFMIIDFKGGGMVNQFRNLPHLVGAITNIDGKAIDRSLKSIKAELKKRQRCFAEAGVNRIDAYIQVRKDNPHMPILPHLIIIVDEFAELKAEQPEFMKELISAARIGRSLGVHLILATQKPAGQVNEQIWSNSKFKLCLKVQNKEDSNEVLRSPLAAEIREPGRAYLQVGNNEIFELFQSAYSGAPIRTSQTVEKTAYTLEQIEENGKRKVIYRQEKEQQDENAYTELTAIVDYVADYCRRKKIEKVPDICMPQLPEQIGYTQLKQADMNPEQVFQIPLGIYDDPDNQYQGIQRLDVMQNNTVIIGSSLYGKTNLLEYMIRYLAEHYTPEEFNFYVLDFGTRVLSVFDQLHHCGGVVCAGEDEKYRNLFKLIHKEMNDRKNRLLQLGVTSYSAYMELDANMHVAPMPLILLVIDNFTALRELYLTDKDELLDICRDGHSLGVTVVMTSTICSGIGYRYLSNFSNKIAYTCNDQSEYNSLFEYCKERPDAIPGRCLTEIVKNKYECQTALAFEGEREVERVSEMRSFMNMLNQRNTGSARRIPVIPEILCQEALIEMTGKREAYEYPIGLEYSEVLPVTIRLREAHILTLSGRDHAGKTTFIRSMLQYMNKRNQVESCCEKYEVYLLDDVRRKLAGVREQSCIKKYSTVPDQAVQCIREIHTQLSERYNRMLLIGQEACDEEPLLVLILNGMEHVNAIGQDKECMELFKDIIGKYRSLGIFILYGRVPNVMVPYNAHEAYKCVKDNRHYLVFEDINLIKLTDISPAIANGYKRSIGVGEGYYIRNMEIQKIKTPIPEGKG